ncbi:hypothetical protein BV898_04588 [Hypsibius exemplaris]|uniref:Kazal-like domain-containing protein n=1 Tax=Hypsibius exemplaris TaxID=2072580 RepID=A0A1W0X1L0_HYPEX|nr:hypothetical protein BV898_04588 [Hypsibius exemplaris]
MATRSPLNAGLYSLAVFLVFASVYPPASSQNRHGGTEILKTSHAPSARQSASPVNAQAEEEAECFVEVKQTRMVPGRCLPVGRRMMPHLCQSKDHQFIAMDNGCVSVLEKKARKTRETDQA